MRCAGGEGGRRPSRTFDRTGDARAFDLDVRRRKQFGALAPSVIQSRQTLAELVEQDWWPHHAVPNLAISTSQQPASATVGSSIADEATVSGATAYACPPYDEGGFALGDGVGDSVTSTNPIFCSYPSFSGESPDDFFCTYSYYTGALVEDHDVGFCPFSAVADGSTGAVPTGTVTFDLYDNSSGAGTPLVTDTESLVGGAATSASYTAAATGTDYWVATYNGDNNYSPTSSSDSGEPVAITAASPVLAGSGGGSLTVGSAISDSGRLSGGYSPGGSLTFTAFPGGSCTGSQLGSTVTVPVSGDGTYPGGSIATPTTAGTDSVLISYSGDADNTAPATVCDAYTVRQAAPVLAGSGGGSLTVGSAISDSGRLSGGYSPGGSLTFTAFPGGSCTGSQLGSTVTVPVSGDGTYPGGSIATPTTAGTDSVLISYSGDADNTAPATVCDAYTVRQAAPVLAGSGGGSLTVGSAISDSGRLSGGYSPGGSLTFTAFPGGSCTGSQLGSTVTVPVSGDGTYPGGSIATPTTAGTDSVLISYSGDADNTAPATVCDAYTVNEVSSASATAPVLSHVREAHAIWVEKAARAPGVPVGTTFFFTLNEAGSIKLTFAADKQGYLVHGHCVTDPHGRTATRTCAYSVAAAGSLTTHAPAGANEVAFDGKTANMRAKLTPGEYLVAIAATASGLSTSVKPLKFTIER